jgi:hypothetical protein
MQDVSRRRQFMLYVAIKAELERIGRILRFIERFSTADEALGTVEQLNLCLNKCRALSCKLASDDHKRDINTTVNMIEESLCQPDVPANMAIIDGENAGAVEIIKSRFSETWQLLQLKILEAESRYLHEAQSLASDKPTDVAVAIGCGVNDFFHMQLPKLKELLANWTESGDLVMEQAIKLFCTTEKAWSKIRIEVGCENISTLKSFEAQVKRYAIRHGIELPTRSPGMKRNRNE